MGESAVRGVPSYPSSPLPPSSSPLPSSSSPQSPPSLPSSGPLLPTPMNEFVGREDLVERAAELVGAQRLVTLVGPGGIGKTRLSMQVATRVAETFADGVTVVPLDVVLDPADVAWRTASALNAVSRTSQPAADQVVQQVADRHLLLVIDNCEHLLEAAGDLVMTILQSCPRAHVLTTSREPLGLSGEHVVALPPLRMPDTCEDLDAVRDSEAVRLLLARAAQADAPLAVTAETCEDILALCRRLDGMPLAIELAAVRLRSLAVTDVLDRLEHRFVLLRGAGRDILPRHRTLEALVDWSYQLCSDKERLVWGRLSVCLSGCDLEAAEAVSAFGSVERHEVLDLLDSLVTKSLLVKEQDHDQTRYRQLVTIREFGEDMARERGEWEQLKARRAGIVLDRVRQLHRTWAGPDQASWLARARRDLPDIVASMDWALGSPATRDLAAGIVAHLRYFWASGYNMNAGRHRLERVLAMDDIDDAARCECLLVVSWVALLQGDHDDAAVRLEEARTLADRLAEDPEHGATGRRQQAEVHTWTGLWHLFCGDPADAAAHYRAGVEVLHAAGDIAAWQVALFQLALCEFYSGDADAAARTCQLLLEESHRNGEAWCKAYGLWVLALVHHRNGDLVAARTQIVEALQIQESFQDAICVAHLLLLVCRLAVADNDLPRALRVQDLADGVWTSIGTRLDAFGASLSGDADAIRRRLARLAESGDCPDRPAPGVIDARTAAIRGREEALGLALEARTGVRLTRRETDVATLLAEGMSNKQIAAELVISTRTVDGHVERILAKYGASSRAQVAVRFREDH